MNRTDLSARAQGNVSDAASRASRQAYEAGASPRGQIDAARKASGSRLNYLPHQGSREMERRRAQMERAAAKAAAKETA